MIEHLFDDDSSFSYFFLLLSSISLSFKESFSSFELLHAQKSFHFFVDEMKLDIINRLQLLANED